MSNGVTLVAGAGGFIGGHLVGELVARGENVRAVDIKAPGQWHQHHEGVDERRLDLTSLEHCIEAVEDADVVYDLAADMGGIGFIEGNKARCMLSSLIGTHLLMAASQAEVERFFFSSSACVYPAGKQTDPDVVALKEDDAYPAQPEDGYGWEKLFTERMCRHFSEDFGLKTRIARFHNIYGPHGTFEGGREKAPAAICRKVALASLFGHTEIEVWGDGEQTRSFTYIDDCVRGIDLIANGDWPFPLNLGSSELVTINELIDLVEQIAGTRLKRAHNLDAPQGVRGRNSDNTLILDSYGWEPSTPLLEGLEKTYAWIYDQLT